MVQFKKKKIEKNCHFVKLIQRQVMNVLDSKLKGSGTFPAWVP